MIFNVLTVFSVIFGFKPNISIFTAIFTIEIAIAFVKCQFSSATASLLFSTVLLQFKYFRLQQCHCQHPVIWRRRMRRRKMRAIIQKLQQQKKYHQFKHFCGNRHNIQIFIEKRTIFIKKVNATGCPRKSGNIPKFMKVLCSEL